MSEFKREKLEYFLSVTRKYMQLKGALSQKELAEKIDVGPSSMSRFLSQKSTELNVQFIAKIVAFLQIPLHEMIDFVDDDYQDRFIKTVRFYQENGFDQNSQGGTFREEKFENHKNDFSSHSQLSIKEKLESLTPRQKAFMAQFLELNVEERDLVVDLGNNLIQYFKTKGLKL